MGEERSSSGVEVEKSVIVASRTDCEDCKR
jgi:hypothetical protein